MKNKCGDSIEEHDHKYKVSGLYPYWFSQKEFLKAKAVLGYRDLKFHNFG